MAVLIVDHSSGSRTQSQIRLKTPGGDFLVAQSGQFSFQFMGMDSIEIDQNVAFPQYMGIISHIGLVSF
jgi:hypothetical protein